MTLKTLVDNLVERIDSLLVILRNRNYGSWIITELSTIRENIAKTKAPLIPSQVIWEKYAYIISLIEEINVMANQPGYEYAVHTSILSLREHFYEFMKLMKKTYVMERIHVSLPAILGSISVLLRLISGDFTHTWIYLPLSITSVISGLLNPLISLLLTSLLGLSFAILDANTGGVFAGVLLITISILYIYLILFAKSQKFSKKLVDIAKGVDRVVKTGMSESPVKIDDVLNSIRSNYSVEDTGVFKFLDRDQLIHYKATVLVAMGLIPGPRVEYSNKNQ